MAGGRTSAVAIEPPRPAVAPMRQSETLEGYTMLGWLKKLFGGDSSSHDGDDAHEDENVAEEQEERTAPLTYRARVDRFWTAFQADEPFLKAYYDNSKDNTPADQQRMIDLTQGHVKTLHPDLAWCYGPALDCKGHCLMLSPEGNAVRLLLTRYWAEHAPRLPGWEFYPAKQAHDCSGMSMRTPAGDFALADVRIALTPNEDRGCPDLTIHHPLFPEIDEDGRGQITMLCLDESLGELGTETWIAAIDIALEEPPHAFPLPELEDKLTAFFHAMDWRRPDPLSNWVNLEFRKPSPDMPYPRADQLTQITMLPSMIADYHNGKGRLADPLTGSGATFAYVSLPMSALPRGEESNARGEMEDALDKLLQESDGGSLVGAGLGLVNAYIDLFLTDGEASVETIRRNARSAGLPPGSELHWFAGPQVNRTVKL